MRVVNQTTTMVTMAVHTQCLRRNRRMVGAAMISPRIAAISTIASKLARCQYMSSRWSHIPNSSNVSASPTP